MRHVARLGAMSWLAAASLSLLALPLIAEDFTPAEGKRFIAGGYVNALGLYEYSEPRAIGTVGLEEDEVDFRAEADVNLLFRSGSGFIALAEINANSERDDDTIDLEQAYARYYFDDDTYVQLGRFHSWMGWERFDAPELWRINPTYTYYNTDDMDGASFGLRFNEQWNVRLFVVEEVITPRRASEFKDGSDLGYGSSLSYRPEDHDTIFKWDFFYDVETAEDITTLNEGGDVWTVSTSMSARNIFDSGFAFSYDFAWADNVNGNQFFWLSALRYDWEDSFVTFMLNYLDENYDDSAINAANDSGFNLFDNERIEFALAYMTYPISDRRFRIGSEVRLLDSTVVDEDVWGVYVQFVFVPNLDPDLFSH